MTADVSLDGRTLVGVSNEGGEVGTETRFDFEQDGDHVRARYAGGEVVEGYLLGTVDGREYDIRYVQINEAGETATGHAIGDVELLDDGRVRVADEWEWESKPGGGETVLEEVEAESSRGESAPEEGH
jgi:hypothetical protein